jgi:hypothetical protein
MGSTKGGGAARKRTSLEALLRPPLPAGPGEEPAPPAPPPATAAASPRRPVKQQTVYLPLPVYEQLRRLAFEERVKMHGLLMEGLDRVFRDRGLPGLDELGERGPDEAG